MAEDRLRERKIYRVTVLGSIINVLLVALKFAFGVLGRSSAMIAAQQQAAGQRPRLRPRQV